MKLRIQPTRLHHVLLLACAVSVPAGALAQHYPAGAEGIRTATLPPPGVYLRDYNIVYWAGEQSFAPLEEVFAYVNAPRVIWMTDWKFLGADYGMDLIVPFGYASADYVGPGPRRVHESEFGLADIQFEPLLLSWHTKRFDVAAGYAIWAPTGDFDLTRVANLGKGFWTHMMTVGATWYPDTEKTWAIGLLNRYEINHEQEDTRITPGDTLTMEWGVSKTVRPGWDLGLVGYWQQQVTDAEVRSGALRAPHSRVVALGPEISALCPKLGLVTSIRYLREFEAQNRPEGNTFTVTFTKRF